MDDDTYFSLPMLSQSQAKLLIPPSTPAHFDYALRHGQAPKAAFDLGHAAHLYTLGKGSQLALIEAGDYRTKAAQEARNAAYAARRVPLLADQYEQVLAMAEALSSVPEIAEILTSPDAHTEVSLIALRDDVWIRGKIDLLLGDMMFDYKTSDRPATIEGFTRSAADHGYYFQATWYLTIAALLNMPIRHFRFIAQEKVPPYYAAVFELDDEWQQLGYQQMTAAIDLYRRCQTSGKWPGYPTTVQKILMPRWLKPSWSPNEGLYDELKQLIGDIENNAIL